MMPLAARAFANRDQSRFWRRLEKLLNAIYWWDQAHCQWQWLRWRERENRKNGVRGRWKRIQ